MTLTRGEPWHRSRPDPSSNRELASNEPPFRAGRVSRSRLAAETGGRKHELALERTVESRFGLIAHFGSDLRHRITAGGQLLRSQLKSPAREVGHGSLVQVTAEALSEHRT